MPAAQGGTLLASLTAMSLVPLRIARPYLRDGTAPGLYSKQPSGKNATGFCHIGALVIQRRFAEMAVWCREIAIPAVVMAVLITASAPANNVYSLAVADVTPATSEITPDAANVPLSGELVSGELVPVEPATTAALPIAAVAADTPKIDASKIDTIKIDTIKIDAPKSDAAKPD